MIASSPRNEADGAGVISDSCSLKVGLFLIGTVITLFSWSALVVLAATRPMTVERAVKIRILSKFMQIRSVVSLSGTFARFESRFSTLLILI